MQVGPCIPVGVQLERAEVGPTSGPTWRLSHHLRSTLSWPTRRPRGRASSSGALHAGGGAIGAARRPRCGDEPTRHPRRRHAHRGGDGLLLPRSGARGWRGVPSAKPGQKSRCRRAAPPAARLSGSLRSEKAVRLAQNVQVGPCIPVGKQIGKAEVGPTSGPTWCLPHSKAS
jgi:hypothetical protein